MINSNEYTSHIEITKELKMNSDFTKVREPYKEDFEKIYNEAKEEKVSISNAKDFLNSLSKEEVSTLQHYSGLADEINVGKLNDEGAYNLLVHHYEKYDFDNDGFVMDGIARTIPPISKNIPNDDKKALVKSLNEMDEKDAFHVMMIISLPKSFKFENGELIPIMNEKQNYSTIMERVERVLNPLPGEYSSQEIKDSFLIFKELFEKNFDEIKNQNIQTHLNSNSQIIKAKIES